METQDKWMRSFLIFLMVLLFTLAWCGAANDYPPLRYSNDEYVYFYYIVPGHKGYILMPRPVRKWIVKLRMWYADIRGHHGKRWNYESSEHYFGRKRK